MKKLIGMVWRTFVIVGILLATIVAVIIASIIDWTYELIYIIRYWVVRGCYEIMVRCNPDDYLSNVWDRNVQAMAKDDAKKALKLFKLKIED